METNKEKPATPPPAQPTDDAAGELLACYQLSDLRAANIARQLEWCPEVQPDLSFRGNELAGETGEACNVIKKLERERHGWRGTRDTAEHLAEELADVVICADLCALAANVDLHSAVIAKFNATSEKQGLSVMLGTRAPQPVQPSKPLCAQSSSPSQSSQLSSSSHSSPNISKTEPSDIATGHNPDQLTNTQVETHLGWRLLEESEIRTEAPWPSLSEIECWCDDDLWVSRYSANIPWQTYRTPLSPADLAKARGIDQPSGETFTDGEMKQMLGEFRPIQPSEPASEGAKECETCGLPIQNQGDGLHCTCDYTMPTTASKSASEAESIERLAKDAASKIAKWRFPYSCQGYYVERLEKELSAKEREVEGLRDSLAGKHRRELAQTQDRLSRIADERDQLSADLAAVGRVASERGAQITFLEVERDDLRQKLAAVTRERDEARQESGFVLYKKLLAELHKLIPEPFDH